LRHTQLSFGRPHDANVIMEMMTGAAQDIEERPGILRNGYKMTADRVISSLAGLHLLLKKSS
jgi:hypothetical protein